MCDKSWAVGFFHVSGSLRRSHITQLRVVFRGTATVSSARIVFNSVLQSVW